MPKYFRRLLPLFEIVNQIPRTITKNGIPGTGGPGGLGVGPGVGGAPGCCGTTVSPVDKEMVLLVCRVFIFAQIFWEIASSF